MRSTDDVMYILYRRRNWTQADIANLFDIDISTVCRHIKSGAINRGIVIPKLMMYNAGTEDKPRILTGRPLFEELYIRREMTTPEIAELLFCSHMTVIRLLEKLNIKRRNRLNNLMNINKICCSSGENTKGEEKNER
jgi:DNA-binding CsgD family transcriptional regulator